MRTTPVVHAATIPVSLTLPAPWTWPDGNGPEGGYPFAVKAEGYVADIEIEDGKAKVTAIREASS